MKKVIAFLFCLFIFLGNLYAQEINQTNENGERVGSWKKYYKNKRIRYEGQFENGKEVGVFKFYSAADSKFPIAIKNFDKDSEVVQVQFFTIKGFLESEGEMIAKDRIGLWVYFHKDGKNKMIEENYENGQLNGEYKIFYVNGKLTKLSHYKDGLLEGNSKKYSQEGVLVENVNYVKNVLNGPAAFYEINGNLKQKGVYEDDLKVGVWEFYTDGQLTSSKEIIVTPVDKD
ncbi:MAG: toxin-antitoxin system YwqK family antitoxin [Urechidicola sp.]|nr:toxin-antitoxin system YwqK family antitoxin [Urechidicola sp.]